MKRLLVLCLFFVCLLQGERIFAGDRYALVIGNNDYRNVPKLINPVNDATAIAASLRDLKYDDVVLKTNLDIVSMEKEIDAFFSKLRRSENSEGFFWFAGHGLSVEEKQHLLGIDVDPASNRSIARGSYTVDDLVAKFREQKNRSNLIVIDACRNVALPGNRALGSRGLAVIHDTSIQGNKIIYSTMAGKTASDGQTGESNSPFAQAFLANIKAVKSFDNAFINIAKDTQRLTGGEQEPYALGYFSVEDYSINPAFSGAQRQHVALAGLDQAPIQAGVSQAKGNLIIQTSMAGAFSITGRDVNLSQDLPEMADMNLNNIIAGTYTVKMTYPDGKVEEQQITIGREQELTVVFEYSGSAAAKVPTAIQPSRLPDASSFSTGRKVGAGFLNIAFGVGSFTMGDSLGGGIVLGGELLSAGLIIWEVAGLSYYDAGAGVPGAIGLGVAALSVAFGFVEPFLFDKGITRSSKKGLQYLNGVNIDLKPGPKGIEGLRFSYSLKY